MTVIDSSALLAIVFGESDAQLYIDAIELAFEKNERLFLPASALVETGIAAERRGCGPELAAVIDSLQAEIVPLTAPIAQQSVAVFRTYGKGLHKAALNLGDCISYATASDLKASLLHKGDDFAQTPIRSAL